MSKKLISIYLFMMMSLIGCYESASDKINLTGDVPMSPTQNNKDWFLTKDEARVALLKKQEKTEEHFRIKQKLVEEAEEALRKWYREHGGLPPDSLSDDLYNATHYRFWENLEEQREIFEKYGDVNFEEFFKEFVVIEYECEVTFPWGENKIYVHQWECDLKEGLFRSAIPEENTGWPDYGRFIKDEDGEWTAIIVVHGGWNLSYGD